MLWPKKNSYKEFDDEKKFLQLENSPPPPLHNFSNGPSLRAHSLLLAVHGMFQHVQHKEPPNHRKPNY